VASAQPATTGGSSTDVMLEVTDLRIVYGEAQAVDGVSFTVPRGSCLAILGANGAGKSSIAQCLAGLVPAQSGTIRIDGEDTTKASGHSLARRGVAFLPEGRGIFPSLSVADNIALGLRVLPKDARAAAEARVEDFFPILGKRRKQQAATLSGGEQQMLAVARALVTEPKLIVVDELSLGLAPLIIDDIYAALVVARQTGTTMVLIEQYVERALSFADEAIVLRRGVVAWSGAANGAAQDVAHSYMGETAVA
jgi:branched-chain amino acid transport system ATP-binding protein